MVDTKCVKKKSLITTGTVKELISRLPKEKKMAKTEVSSKIVQIKSYEIKTLVTRKS